MNNKYYILRHGESLSNKKQIISCWPEKFYSPLTQKGRKQIKIQAKKLKKEKIDLIFASDLLRTRQTAEIVSKELGISPKYDKRLREYGFGIFNGKPIEEAAEFFDSAEKNFKLRPPKGENYNDIKKRMFDFFKEIDKKYSEKTILIISHGDPIWLLLGELRGVNEDELLEERNTKGFYPQIGELRKLEL